ncbi:PREDICTED: coiled-coil domain-containing protein 178 [Gekko japonicus]|uniref:Coiled-coil domain-containing protein 178 n=1 Tax=Gekko japonicus TaxID=146911 RepID=A0ABM1L7E1_GEKJA|nr:PREDICTED: coiled-coil domain-containing protein 178 [Gekko japonicus]
MTETPVSANEKMSLDSPAKQRSCTAVNTPSACVNKAIHHIQDLEVKMEETSPWHSRLKMLTSVLRYSDMKTAEETKDIWLSASSELKADVSVYWNDIQPLKQKTTDVLAEATELVTRLEHECKAAEEALEVERHRKKKLQLNSDYLSLWRLQQLPVAVQEEWENCSQDIIELQLHFEDKNQQLQDAVNQLTKIEVANEKIQENIDFMKKYSPLLGEKLSYEDNRMEEIKKAYNETKIRYDNVHQKLLDVRDLHQKITEEYEQERISMYQKRRAAEMLLNRTENELKEVEAVYGDLCFKIKNIEEAIMQNKKRLEELVKQESDTKTDITSWQAKLKRLTSKIAVQEKENKELLEGFHTEFKQMEDSKSSQQSDLQKLKETLKNKLQKISDLRKENKYLHEENEEFMQKFKDISRKKIDLQAEIRILLKNIHRLEEHLKKIVKELYASELTYSEAKMKLEELEQNINKGKMRFKNLEDNVKKQIRDEISAWQLTQKRIKSLYSELEKRKKENEKKENKVQQALEEIEKYVAVQSELLRKNKDKHVYIFQKISELNQMLQELEQQEKNRKKEYEDKKKFFQSQLKDMQMKYLGISSKLDEVNKTIENFQNQISKLNELSKGQQNQVESTEKSVEELRKKFARIKSKEQNAQTLVDFLHDRLKYIEKKVKTDGRIFEDLLWTRQKNLKQKKTGLDNAMEENLRLAQEYQMLQICYLNSKDKLMDLCNNKVRAEGALRDKQQLFRLQSKMHKVLVEYFKLRGLYSQAGLAKFQAVSHENVQKILAVQFSSYDGSGTPKWIATLTGQREQQTWFDKKANQQRVLTEHKSESRDAKHATIVFNEPQLMSYL